MENNKTIWINEVAGSYKGMKRATPSGDVYIAIQSRLSESPVKLVSFPVKQWAAAAILLLSLNVGSIFYYSLHAGTGKATTNPLAAQIESGSTYNY